MEKIHDYLILIGLRQKWNYYRFPEISRSPPKIPKLIRKRPTISEDDSKLSENCRRWADDFHSGYLFSCAWQQLRVFPRLAAITWFPELGSSYLFFRAWKQLHIFPRLAAVTCFPTLGCSYKFSRAGCSYLDSRAWLQLLVFPRLAAVTSFPALGTCCLFLPRALISSLRQLHLHFK